MVICDTHCDTISELLNQKKSLFENDVHLDLKRMKNYDGFSQCFAAFIDPEFYDAPKKRFLDIYNKFVMELEENKAQMMQCKSFSDYQIAIKSGLVAAFLTIEGGECVCNIDDIDEYYNYGVRLMALTWNNKNRIATGVESPESSGLSDFGVGVVRKMNDVGMIVDVSHLNECSFYDVAKINRGPLFATHSNSRVICNHKRNLEDEQFKIIAKSHGFVGINIYPEFLTKKKECTIDDILLHIEHFLSLGGEDVIGLGCDLDGVERLPNGIKGIEDLWKIFDEMKKRGHKKDVIDKIAHKNFERAIKFF